MASPSPAPRAVVNEQALHFQDQVRNHRDLERLAAFNDRMYVPLVMSALIPIVVAASRASTDSWVSIVVNVVAWLVFVLDLVVHMALIRHFLRTRTGVFDLVVVILTAPWFLVPGLGNSQILVLARLARLFRLVAVSKRGRQAFTRLGKVGLFVLAMLLFSSWMAYVAEHPANPEFADFGDALWWGIVTLTTVGYGDIVPLTTKGRFAGVSLMLTGIASLGIISGTLASMFRVGSSATSEPDEPPAPRPTAPEPAAPGPAAGPDGSAPNPVPIAGGADVAGELAAVREQLVAVEQRLAALAVSPTDRPAG